MTLQQLLDQGTEQLRSAGVPDAGLDARYLLLDTFGLGLASFLADRGRTVDGLPGGAEKAQAYEALIARRAGRIPLQQLLGVQEFMGLEFFVNEHVLIPRQDTETLVELVLEERKQRDLDVLDVCTGSGCIAVSLARLGEYRSVTALDVSAEALKVAEKNAAALLGEYDGDFRLVQSDMFAGLETKETEAQPGQEPGKAEILPGQEPGKAEVLPGQEPGKAEILPEQAAGKAAASRDLTRPALTPQFDILVSNPPYIPSQVIEGLEPEVRDHEPRLALDGSPDGLKFYRILASEGKRFLRPGGSVYFEIGWDQAQAVSALLEREGFTQIRTVKDMAGMDRVVGAVLGAAADNGHQAPGRSRETVRTIQARPMEQGI